VDRAHEALIGENRVERESGPRYFLPRIKDLTEDGDERHVGFWGGTGGRRIEKEQEYRSVVP